MERTVSLDANTLVRRIQSTAIELEHQRVLDSDPPGPPLLMAPELSYLNEHWTLEVSRDHLRDVGLVTFVRRRTKATIARLVFPIFREFLERLVTMQNSICNRSDVLQENLEDIRYELLKIEERQTAMRDDVNEEDSATGGAADRVSGTARVAFVVSVWGDPSRQDQAYVRQIAGALATVSDVDILLARRGTRGGARRSLSGGVLPSDTTGSESAGSD